MLEHLSYGDLGFGDELLIGTLLTLQLALVSLLVGIILGLLAAAAKLSNNRFYRLIAQGYSELVRGVPEMLVVLVVYFGASALLQTIAGWFDYNEYIEVNAFVAGVFALGLVFGAFSSEVFRGAFLAVPKGQMEAALACGMTSWQAFYRIRLPQMWRFAIPGLGRYFVQKQELVDLMNLATDQAALLAYGGFKIEQGELTLGVLLAFFQYGMRFFKPIQDLSEKYNILQAAMAVPARPFMTTSMFSLTGPVVTALPASAGNAGGRPEPLG